MIKYLQEYIDFKIVGVAAIAIGLASCNAGNSVQVSPASSVTTQGQFVQIERLARPAVKEAFQNYTGHDQTNRSSPYADPTLAASIESFTNAFRQPAYGQTLAAILVPDELQADLSQNVAATYLGVETKGATGGLFGGRDPQNDIISTSLGAIFGNTLSALNLVTDDHQEVPCLTTDNEPGANTADGNTTIAAITAKNGFSATFPYIGPAH
jgi:hypothetical protein